MKALIRNEGETVLESDGIKGIDWKTGTPLTNPMWAGGPYDMVDNYEENIVHSEHPKIEEKIVEEDDVVIIEGKRYSKEELRSLLK